MIRVRGSEGAHKKPSTEMILVLGLVVTALEESALTLLGRGYAFSEEKRALGHVY